MLSFDKLYRRMALPVLTTAERAKCSVLIVESDLGVKHTMRQTLAGLGYGTITDAQNHAAAVQKVGERAVTHAIFEAKKTNMLAKEFLAACFERDSNIIMIPSSFDPTVDDVFNLLIMGAKGYLVKPFTADGLDSTLVMATKGEPISDAILYAKNRNEALASLILTSLDNLTNLMKQAEQFETARREVPGRVLTLHRAVDIGRTFAQGGDDQLLTAILDFCEERSNGPASRLGRLRKRLNEKKGSNSGATLKETEIPPPVQIDSLPKS